MKAKEPYNPLYLYLQGKGLKPTPWAIGNGISPSVISRYLRGSELSPANAKRIERATKGKVKTKTLLYWRGT